LAQTPWATTEHVRVALALESPDVEVSGLTEANRSPDFVARLRWQASAEKEQHLQASVLVRQLRGFAPNAPGRFLGIDHSLRRDHGIAYDHYGRFVMAGAVLSGWLVAELTAVSKPVVITGLGLVSGGVVMNSMVMELPEGQEGRFWPFALGRSAMQSSS
jgi:hypothetical protein